MDTKAINEVLRHISKARDQQARLLRSIEKRRPGYWYVDHGVTDWWA